MKMLMIVLMLSVVTPFSAQNLSAADYADSSAKLPIAEAVNASKIAGKSIADYAALRGREAQIFKELGAPEFERLPRREREVKRAEAITELGSIARQQKGLLETYKVHLGNAITALGNIGPAQMAGAQADIQRIMTTVSGAITQHTVTASALSDVAKLGGGLDPKLEQQYRNIIKQLKRKQAMEAQIQLSSKRLASATETTEAIIDYLKEVHVAVDMGVVEADINIALNSGAMAAHMVREMSFQLCGATECRPDKMFQAGPSYDTLINGLGTGQPAAGADEKSTQEYVEQYSTR